MRTPNMTKSLFLFVAVLVIISLACSSSIAKPTATLTPIQVVTAQLTDFSVEGAHSIAFTPDSAMIAVGTEDGIIVLWDVQSQEEKGRLEGHTGLAASIAFSPDGSLMASGHSDGTIILWDVNSGEILRRLTKHTDAITSGTFTDHNLWLWTGGLDGHVYFWDAADGGLVVEGAGYFGIIALAYSPAGLLAVADESGKITVLDTQSNVSNPLPQMYNLQASLNNDDLFEFQILEPKIAFSPDGKLLASPALIIGKSSMGIIFLWDMSNGEEMRRLGEPDSPQAGAGAIRCVAFSPDGFLLASGSISGTVDIWDVNTGTMVHSLDGVYPSWGITFSPDEKLLATVGEDKVIVWSVSVNH